ncbi:ComEC/Rec2-related protein [Magnetospirillum sp. LM-5]|uniref:ComEC/Rec2 family competence protein n=1 Tax=Magnetospirillum sp. LM-5 TaxID=2681466 RepID=UPI00137EE165|nr:ComEC/Rec2 family competence protein [Magnetospirillum sp. LM-5]CAA7617238.1 ComEC/Rec2-related protein [Magnetospirillum sp. LM-5]
MTARRVGGTEIFLPDRIGKILTERLGVFLLAERDRWVLWLPVAVGLGISLYFAVSFEPPSWVGGVLLALCLGGAWLGRKVAAVWTVMAVMALVAGGFTVAQLRSAWVAAPVLERPSGKVTLSGLAAEVEPLAGGGQRVTLDHVSMAMDGPVPHRVRLRFKTDQPIPVGAKVSVAAILTPPPQPSLPGAFDFARHAWFQGLGAVGTALGPPDIEMAEGGGGLNAIRAAIGRRIMAVLPGAIGAVAQALITGEVGAIPRDVLDAYRDSGLAHLLSISGLHMSLLAGLVFFVVRGGLALWPTVALSYPIKKWAAAFAILATFLYMLLAGAPVPAQRSFLMTGIVLAAVLLDRAALSMRLVAWAAVVVLVIAPEALIGPSFQMSFAAVAALIAAYEVVSPRVAQWQIQHRGWHHQVGLYLFGVLFSSLVAGLATTVYGGFHFHRLAVWSVLANMVAVPLTGFLVMPFAVLALVLMPLGLEGVALAPMGWGVDAVNRVAVAVAAWPAAGQRLPVLPIEGLAIFTLGGLWLLLWRTRWRLWGLAAMAAGLATFVLVRPPDIVVDSRGYSFGVRTGDGALLVNRGGRLVRESWDRRAGPLAAERWPKAGRSADGRLGCDGLGCLYRAPAGPVALVQDEAGIEAACVAAVAVVAAVPLRQACRGPHTVIDRFDLWRRGAHALWLEPGRARIETVAGWQGDRPWAHRPHRRKKPEPTEPPVEAED